jgi:hypothetical protein
MDGIGLLLEREGIEYVRIDGMTPPYARPRRFLAASVQCSSDLQSNSIIQQTTSARVGGLLPEPAQLQSRRVGVRAYTSTDKWLDAGGDIDGVFLLSLVRSLTSAGVGLTMTKAEAVIMTELYWNPGVRSPFALTARASGELN